MLHDEQGVVLPSVLMLIAVLAVVGATSMRAALLDLRISGAFYKSVAAFHIAEAGLTHGRHEVSDEDGVRDFLDILAPTTLFSGRAFHGGSYTVVAVPGDRRHAGQAPAACPWHVTLPANPMPSRQCPGLRLKPCSSMILPAPRHGKGSGW